MLGFFGTTAGKIDDFEARFTNVRGAHFLIAGNGREAWPVTATEAEAYKALYRRRMVIARWIRRIAVAAPILLFMLFWSIPVGPKPVAAVIGYAFGGLFLFAINVGLPQHPITSWVTKRGIERRLRDRLRTGMQAAVTPAYTPLGRFARRLLVIGLIMELVLFAIFVCFGPTIVAERLGTITDRPPEWILPVFIVLPKLTHGMLLIAGLLLILDRWSRRQAAREKPDAPVTMPR